MRLPQSQTVHQASMHVERRQEAAEQVHCTPAQVRPRATWQSSTTMWFCAGCVGAGCVACEPPEESHQERLGRGLTTAVTVCGSRLRGAPSVSASNKLCL